jgi:aminocarboxymuconate-semialdehyde decarboxylase
VHPTTRGFPEPVLDQYYLRNLVGNPMETTITAAHMVLAGVMERHRTLKVLLAHGGGAIVTLRGRLGAGQEMVAEAGAELSEPVNASIGRFLFDTVTHDPATLRALVEMVGADRVLLGSDYPFDMADPHPVETVRAAGLDRAAEEALLFANAERVLGFDLVRAR